MKAIVSVLAIVALLAACADGKAPVVTTASAAPTCPLPAQAQSRVAGKPLTAIVANWPESARGGSSYALFARVAAGQGSPEDEAMVRDCGVAF